jgi:hypothetical protein
MKAGMRRALVAVLLVAGCHGESQEKRPCAPGLPPAFEVRSGSGQLELSVKSSDMPDARDLCDTQSKRIGRVVLHGDLVTLADESGATIARLQKESPADWSATGRKGALFRVHTSPEGARVLTPGGAPYAPSAIERALIDLASKTNR